MPTHMRRAFFVEDMHKLVGLAKPFSFTKGCQTLKIDAGDPWGCSYEFGHLLFHIDDIKQQCPLNDNKLENRMIQLLIREMRPNDAPPEQFERLGLDKAVDRLR